MSEATITLEEYVQLIEEASAERQKILSQEKARRDKIYAEASAKYWEIANPAYRAHAAAQDKLRHTKRSSWRNRKATKAEYEKALKAVNEASDNLRKIADAAEAEKSKTGKVAQVRYQAVCDFTQSKYNKAIEAAKARLDEE